MKTRGIKIFNLLLCLFFVVTVLVSCNNKDDETKEQEVYYSFVEVDYNPNGAYSGSLFFNDEIDDSFKDLNKNDFILRTLVSKGEDNVSVDLNDFTIKKTNEKELSFTFKSPFEYDDNVSYVLASNQAVTAKNNKIMAIVQVKAPEPELDIQYEGAYKGTNKITITATLKDGWKFVDKIIDDMLIFPEGFNASINVVRESDTKVIFTITNIPTNYSGIILNATLSKDAIDSEFAKDTYLALDFVQPNITVDSSSISFNEETNIFTVGKVIIPEDMKGVQNGITRTSSLYTITEQSYNESENYYSFKLQINEDIEEDVNAEDLLPYISVNVALKTENEVFKYKLYPYNAIAGISGNVEVYTENNKVYMEITPYNATFKNGLSDSDITITGQNGLTNFVVSSISNDKIVCVADYTSDLTNGVLVNFEMSGDSLNTSYSLDKYSIMLYVPSYIGDANRDVDWEALGKSAATGLASEIGSSIAGFVLPYVYDWLEIDTSNPELNEIKSLISNLNFAVNDLSTDINNVKENIEAGTNRAILDNFQSVETSLTTSCISLLSDDNVLNYVKYLKNAFANYREPDFSDILAQQQFERFYDYYKSHVFNDTNSKERVIQLYNDWVENCHLSDEEDFYMTIRFNLLFSDCMLVNRHQGDLDYREVYQMLSESDPYEPIVIPTIERNENFEQAVKNLNYNNALINNTIDYGNRILGNASGTSNGVIELFFQIIDSMYNFESQTISIKRAFVTKVQSIYLMSSAIAIQYCDAIGDSNAKLIRSKVESVMEKINAAYKQIDEMEARGKKGNEKLLVSGQVVSKTMAKTTAKKGERNTINGNYTNVESVSEQTYRTMIERALKRNVSLAEDLKSAGFTNVDPVSNENYLYMTSGFKSKDVSTTWDYIKGGIKLWFYTDDEPAYEAYVTTVSQNGKGAANVTHEMTTYITFDHKQSIWSSWIYGDDGYYSYEVPNYNLIIGFAPAKR